MKLLSRAAILLCAACLLLLPLLTSCSKTDKIKIEVHLTYDAARGALVSEEDGLCYLFAPVSYEPAIVSHPYADWDDMVLYTVKGWDPRKLLTEEYSGIGGLLYAADSPLPSFADMNCTSIEVCAEDQYLNTVDDADVVARAVSAMTTGETVALPTDGTSVYHLRFCSKDYAGIYYIVLFITRGEGPDGSYYLYDRGTKRCVQVPYELFLDWIYDEESGTQTETNTETSA